MNSITSLSTDDFPAILELSDLLFGYGFLSDSELKSYVDDINKAGFVSRSNDTITGFQLILWCDIDELKSLIIHQENWFIETFSDKLPLGVIKMIGVNHAYKNRGIGTSLTKHSIEFLQKRSKSVMSICWDQKTETSFSRVLEKCGMKFVHKINAYWKEDSMKKQYMCKICGSPPCLCDALIYRFI